MSNITFTGTIGAWLSDPSWKGIDYVIEQVRNGKNDAASNDIAYSNQDMTSSGWVKVGTATVTVTLDGIDEITAGQVLALQSQLEKFRANAHLHEQQILARISKLQAITFDGVVA